MPSLTGEGEKAGDGAVGVAGTVVPAGNRIDGDGRIDALAIAVGTEAGWRDRRIGCQGVVAEAKFADEFRHPEVAAMLGNRRTGELAFGVGIDRLRAGQVRILEVGKPCKKLAPVLVQ